MGRGWENCWEVDHWVVGGDWDKWVVGGDWEIRWEVSKWVLGGDWENRGVGNLVVGPGLGVDESLGGIY